MSWSVRVAPEEVTEAKVKLSGSSVHELKDWRYDWLEDNAVPPPPMPPGWSSELSELSEPDHADLPDRFNRGVAPVPSMSLGCNKLPS